MHFLPITTILSLAAIMTTGFCLPNPISSKNLAVRAPTEGLETAVLWNGQEWKNVTVGLPGVSDVDTTPSKLFKRDDLNCKGSGLCNNLAGGATRSNCLAAYNKIFDSVRYHAGGSGSGACSGHCGVFIKSWNGRGDCEYPGGDLKYGYNDLRNFGCTICGQNRYTNPKDVGCGMQIDYVSGC